MIDFTIGHSSLETIMKILCLITILVSLKSTKAGDTSLYEYFAGSEINEGLTASGQEFKLNGKEIKILSGSLHYFRCPNNSTLTKSRVILHESEV